VYSSFIDVCRDYQGREYSPSQIRALFGPTELGIFRRLIPAHAEAATDRFVDLFESDWAQRPRRDPEMTHLLQWLAERSYGLGVVTGCGTRRAELTLTLLDLSHLVDVLACGSLEGSNKPASLMSMATQWQLEPSQVAYLGDSPKDMKDALEAHAIPLGAAWYPGADSPEVLREAGAAEVFTTVSDLRTWLEQA
jgi:pyrophosphatase PpaX